MFSYAETSLSSTAQIPNAVSDTNPEFTARLTPAPINFLFIFIFATM
jgi:hypothetical protein